MVALCFLYAAGGLEWGLTRGSRSLSHSVNGLGSLAGQSDATVQLDPSYLDHQRVENADECTLLGIEALFDICFDSEF